MTTSSIFWRQTWALTKKTLYIAIIRHWFSTLFRALILPIAFLILLLNIKNIILGNNTYGVGNPALVQSLDSALPSSQKLVFVQQNGLGSDISEVIGTINNTLSKDKNVLVVSDENDLLTICRQNLHGSSGCFAAVTFNDSPLTNSTNSKGVWDYTIHADSVHNGFSFHVNGHTNDEDRIYLPLQVAVENAITNSTLVPSQYMFTSVTPAAEDLSNREQYQRLVISTYSVAFFISMVSPVYHTVGMITSERESGMTHLIDAMGGSSQSRVFSHVLAFDLMYLPCWIIFGFLFWNELFETSSLLTSLFWQILVGWAVTSASIFSAMFFNRAQMAGFYSTIGFLIVALCGQLMNYGIPATASVGVTSFLFPSMNYVFMLGYMCRYEEQGLATNMLRAADSTPDEASTSRIPAALLWAFLVLQIIIYPILAVVAEKWVHGSRSEGRTTGLTPDDIDRPAAIEISGLTKMYPPTFFRRYFCCTKAREVVAVQNLDLAIPKGQIVCLLGANGSGKTTTLDLIGGLQKLSDGLIRINAAPSQIGICPQRNILWDELTVEEHVRIWNEIKVSPEAKPLLNDLIEACDLASKKNARAGTLSGGQKRKLQLACTFIGGSTICLLDEVTSGLDPLSRRVIWDILLAQRGRRTIVLTTHFLDEADVLADEVCIISRGKKKCQGSTVELKTQFGGGYRVHLQASEPGPDLGCPIATLPNETIYNTPDSSAAAAVISKLEHTGLSNVFVNGPTIEEVFLRLAEEAQKSLEEPSNGLPASMDGNAQYDSEKVDNLDCQLSPGGQTTLFQQVRVLYLKRLKVLSRNWWPYLIVVVLPLAVVPNLHLFLQFYKIPSCFDLTANVHQPQQFSFQNGFRRALSNLQILAGPLSLNETLYTVLSSFPVGTGLNLQNYTNQFVFEDTLPNFQSYVEANYTSLFPGGIYMSSNGSATYAYVGDFGILPVMTLQNLWTQLRTGVTVTGRFSFFNSLVSPTAGNSIQYVAYFCLAQAVYPAFFVLYPTYEKTRQIRALQYSNGIRIFPLWIAYLIFDFQFVLLISIACTAIISTQAPNWFAVGYMFPVLALYGLSATLMGYAISIVARSQLGAFAWTAGVQAIMFLLSILAFVLIEAFSNSSNLLPALDGTTFGLNLIFPIGNVVRAMVVGLNAYIVDCRNGQIVTYPGSIYAYGGPILYLCMQACLLFWLVTSLEEARRLPSLGRKVVDHAEGRGSRQNNDIKDEETRVRGSKTDLLRMVNVSKSFGSNKAVDNVSLGISRGEILALLGPNGAGKTTLINMVRGVQVADHGTILVHDIDMAKKRYMGQRYLGYCPQFDALDILTIKEHLEFYARAKGVTSISEDVNRVMENLGLKQYETRLASKLSGGNKRKLSLAIAILGNPPVLLLDEPSSSMDAVSKRAMWKTLSRVTSGRSILLTTHSMEEADALAIRAAILSKHLLALGSTSYLRQKYGNVYHVHLVLKSAPVSSPEEMNSVENWVRTSFPHAVFGKYGNFHGQTKFSVPAVSQQTEGESTDADAITSVGKRTAKSGVGILFSILEKNKERIGLQFYSIRPTTMDEVFLNIVRENNINEEGV